MPLSADEKQYYKTILIADYECGPGGIMKPGFLLRHFQQISGEHVAELGMDYRKLLECRQVFLLSKIHLKVLRMPIGGENITVVTTPKQPVSAQFIRVNEAFDEKNQRILQMDTAWLLVDPVDRKIYRPKMYKGRLPELEPDPEASQIGKKRLAAPEHLLSAESRKVRRSDIDVNCHVNNAVYADIIMDALPDGDFGKLKEMYIHYRSEAREGEELSLFYAALPDGEWYVSGNKKDSLSFESLVTFSSGENSEFGL